MVSIIVPAYNCEKYISKCIECILYQNEADIEVIIIDDGSKDRTPQILDAYTKMDARVHVFHVENGGPSKARNIGLDNAKGEWVMFVDADDWLDSDILSHLHLYEKKSDIIFFGFKRCYEDLREDYCLPLAVDYTISIEEIASHLKTLLNSEAEFFGYSVNKVYKRSVIEKYHIRFKEGLNIREDEVFALNYCLYVKSLEVVSFAPYNYRILNCSLSHSSKILFRNYRLLIETELQILDKYPLSDFKIAFIKKIFKYYLASIIECIQLNKEDKQMVIENAISFYDDYKQYLVAPFWQMFLLNFPIKGMRKFLVYSIFYIRNKLS